MLGDARNRVAVPTAALLSWETGPPPRGYNAQQTFVIPAALGDGLLLASLVNPAACSSVDR